jgi:hypothetical protein
MRAPVLSPDPDFLDMKTARVLLSSLIDYAGLFPPAGLSMREAVRNYATHLTGKHAWALGRFVVPAPALEEFERAGQEAAVGAGGGAWSVSALAGPDLETDVLHIADFNERCARVTSGWRAVVDALEVKVSCADEVRSVFAAVPVELQVYFELPVSSEPAALIAAIAEGRGCAKIRTGGTTAPLFPDTAQVARFLHNCVGARVPFKATAGLHHALRGVYRLTYDKGSPSALMHGFLNVFVAAALVHSGLEFAETVELLDDGSREGFRFTEREVTWRSRSISLDRLSQARREFALSFGSCSFREPIDDLKALGMLEG